MRSKEDLDKPLVCSVMVISLKLTRNGSCELSGYDPLLPASDESDSPEMFVEFSISWSALCIELCIIDLENMGVRASMSVVSSHRDHILLLAR